MEAVQHYLKGLIKSALVPLRLARVVLKRRPIFHERFSQGKTDYPIDISANLNDSGSKGYANLADADPPDPPPPPSLISS